MCGVAYEGQAPDVEGWDWGAEEQWPAFDVCCFAEFW